MQMYRKSNKKLLLNRTASPTEVISFFFEFSAEPSRLVWAVVGIGGSEEAVVGLGGAAGSRQFAISFDTAK